MEIILLKDVKGIGKKGEEKTVNDGYANNFLIPRKLAVKKNEYNIAALEKEKEKERVLQEKLKEDAIKNKEILENTTFEFKAKAQKDGRMAGTISTKAIVEYAKKELNIDLDKRKFVDKILVNAFGVTYLTIELYKGIEAKLKIHVSEEK